MTSVININLGTRKAYIIEDRKYLEVEYQHEE